MGRVSRINGLATILLWLAAGGAFAEQGRIHLTDGTVLRGDVELTETEAILGNAAGQAAFPRVDVERIEWLEDAKSVEADYLRRLWAIPTDDVAAHLELARWLEQRRFFDQAVELCDHVLKLDPNSREAAELRAKLIEQGGSESAETTTSKPARASEPAAATQPLRPGLSPPALLDKRDILRIKLCELNLDGAPERLDVRFSRTRGERDLIEQIREDLKKADEYDPDWDAVLEKGRPYEQLPIVLKATGLKYIDRIELRESPRTFDTFRRRVLPMVVRGCGRPACHGSVGGEGFSLPGGSQAGDEFVYTSFVILDGIKTPDGPLIDRGDPAASVLLDYLLPATEDRPRHPPVERGRVNPILRTTTDSRYQEIVNWIHSLRTPHPDYGLEYAYPEWYGGVSNESRAASRPAGGGELESRWRR